MTHKLRTLIAERLVEGLRSKSLSSCSRWACARRVIGGENFPGPWTFKHHPWLEAMHDSKAELNVGQKSAQMGYTETVLNITFYNVDVKGIDCLYVLPAKTPDASDFSAGRFDPALELSPHLSKIFSDVKNVGHKRAGSTNLYIRGSRSRGGLKSIPVGFIVLDELDEMTQENIPLAMERAAGQLRKSVWMISTATIDNHGINFYFNQSSQNHFFFDCPACSRKTELIFPESLVITARDLDDPALNDSHLICKECQAVLPHETKADWLSTGQWVEGHAQRDSKGWYINQLYSPTVTPKEISRLYLQSLNDKASEQEFYNSKLGLPHIVDGAKVTDEHIEGCLDGYENGNSPARTPLVTMGIDVGTFLHVEIDEWFLPPERVGTDLHMFAACRLLKCLKIKSKDFSELDELMQEWGVRYAVIDAQPERRLSLNFAQRWYGRVSVCWYPNGIYGKQLHVSETELSVSVDRTSWLDSSLGRIRRGKPWMRLPHNVDFEYRNQLKTLTRIYEEDQNGNPIGRYVREKGAADHYAHARNYSEIALGLAVGLGVPSDIKNAY